MPRQLSVQKACRDAMREFPGRYVGVQFDAQHFTQYPDAPLKCEWTLCLQPAANDVDSVGIYRGATPAEALAKAVAERVPAIVSQEFPADPAPVES